MGMRIFFSTDIHGATSVWRKWLRVPETHQVDVLLLCGDLAGKAMVPIIRGYDGTHKVFYHGENHILETEDQVATMQAKLCEEGWYSIRCTQEEVEDWTSNRDQLAKIFSNLIEERIAQWMQMLVKKINLASTKAVIMPGNDDPYEMDQVIRSFEEEGVIWCLDRVVEIAGLEMISLAEVNPTPWNTPREAKEGRLSKTIGQLIRKLREPDRAIFNFHCPPYGTRLDLAPELDKNMRPVTMAGQVNYIHAGSKAVRKAIEEYQPQIGLHGHIHESPGMERIGSTTIVNPGSEYGEGILRGYIIEVADRSLRNCWRVEG